METNDSNLKPQQTGGLKLMTVFVFVIAAHAIAIGGVTAYYMLKGGSPDMDLTDKNNKGVKVTPDGTVALDGQLPDGVTSDKSATTSLAPSDTSMTPAPAMASTSPTETGMTPSVQSMPTVTSSVPTTISPAPAQTGPVITPAQNSAPVTTVATEPVTPPVVQSETLVGTTYVVKPNDTLARIAHRHHTTMAQLKTANSLNGDLLHLGQKLIIPTKAQIVSASTPATTPDAPGTTTILSNDTTVPAPVSTAPAAPALATSDHHIYTVVKGDTLSRIAHKFKTTPKALMAANNITDPTRLGIGKKLRIPFREAQSATTATPDATQPRPVKAKTGPAAQLANYMQ